MKFFVPGVSEDDLDKIYRVYRASVSAAMGDELSEVRYYSIDFTDNGGRHNNVVGERDRESGKIVLCIFRSTNESGPFYVFLQERPGYYGGAAIMAGGGSNTYATTFDRYLPHHLNSAT